MKIDFTSRIYCDPNIDLNVYTLDWLYKVPMYAIKAFFPGTTQVRVRSTTSIKRPNGFIGGRCMTLRHSTDVVKHARASHR